MATSGTGGRPFTINELAGWATAVTGIKVGSTDVSPADLTAALIAAWLDAGAAGFVTALGVATGRADLDTDPECPEHPDRPGRARCWPRDRPARAGVHSGGPAPDLP